MNTGLFAFNAFAETWLMSLWRACWQGGSALLIVWIVCRVFHRLPSGTKVWLWRLAYAKLLVAFLWTTPIELPLLRASPTPPSPPVTVPNLVIQTSPTTSTLDTRREIAIPAKPTLERRPLINTSSALMVIWGLGVIWIGCRTGRDLLATRLLRRRCHPVADDRLSRCSQELGHHFGLRPVPNLLMADAVSSPLVLGMAHPLIVLPSSLVPQSSFEHLRLMVAHEMAHLKRRDLWWVWLAVVGEALFFFHPAVWLAKREWRLTQEMACDEMAVRMTRSPASSYGDMLVGVTALIQTGTREPMLITLGVTETKKTIKRRLTAMKFIQMHSTKRIAFATGMILVAGLLNVLPWRLVAQEPGTTTAPANTGESRPAAATPPEGTARFGGGSRAGGFGGTMSTRAALAAPRPPTDVAPARFEATVFEIEVPESRIAALDAQVLEAKAATPEELAKAMAEFGKTRILHKIDQTVNLYGENIMLGTSEPMVTGTRTSTSGQAMNSISYQQVGLIVNLSASKPPKESSRKGLDVQANFELSAMVASGVELAPGFKASSIRSVKFSQSGTPRFGKPTVLLNVSASNGGDKAPSVAYVVRYVFSETKP